jgi:hypothetical protein
LLASRLDALEPGAALDRREPVDLLGLAAEEAARSGAEVGGEPATIVGDPALLRRLLRNLLENARRHAGGGAVELEVAKLGPGGARVRVADRGAGVADGRAYLLLSYRPPARASPGRLLARPGARAPDRAIRRTRAVARATAAERSSESIWEDSHDGVDRRRKRA